MSLDWESVTAFALSLPGTELAPYYGAPSVKVNDRAFVMPGREPDSFCLALDRDTIAMLKETAPETFWQTPHYEGWPAVLVRYDSPDPDRVHALIERSHAWNAARRKPKPRRT
ncbi:MmcQ/YjbR family DNA-binding protein [Sphingobium ummariense]